MSIAGYFSRTHELRTSRKPSPLGIGFEGEVLTGEKSVEEKQRHEAILAANPLDEAYKYVEDYDPVLLHHLGLTKHDVSTRTEPDQTETRRAIPAAENFIFADEPTK